MKPITFFICCLAIISCSKSEDFRSQYVGSWQFTNTTHSFNAIDSTSSYSVVVYDGFIDKDPNSSGIILKYSDTDIETLEINENGEIIPSSQYRSGGFSNESEFTMTNRWGGNGGGGSFTVKGIKQ